jgi:hypothetical protein
MFFLAIIIIIISVTIIDVIRVATGAFFEEHITYMPTDLKCTINQTEFHVGVQIFVTVGLCLNV